MSVFSSDRGKPMNSFLPPLLLHDSRNFQSNVGTRGIIAAGLKPRASKSLIQLPSERKAKKLKFQELHRTSSTPVLPQIPNKKSHGSSKSAHTSIHRLHEKLMQGNYGLQTQRQEIDSNKSRKMYKSPKLGSFIQKMRDEKN